MSEVSIAFAVEWKLVLHSYVTLHSEFVAKKNRVRDTFCLFFILFVTLHSLLLYSFSLSTLFLTLGHSILSCFTLFHSLLSFLLLPSCFTLGHCLLSCFTLSHSLHSSLVFSTHTLLLYSLSISTLLFYSFPLSTLFPSLFHSYSLVWLLITLSLCMTCRVSTSSILGEFVLYLKPDPAEISGHAERACERDHVSSRPFLRSIGLFPRLFWHPLQGSFGTLRMLALSRAHSHTHTHLVKSPGLSIGRAWIFAGLPPNALPWCLGCAEV